MPTSTWPFVPVLGRLTLAAAIGMFVGLERELNGKVGVRTFALAGLLGCMGSLLGLGMAAVAMGFVMVLVVAMNWREMVVRSKLVLTTSSALGVVALCGVLCGQGHLFTPVAGGVIAAALLTWKRPLTGFVQGITEEEIRAAILLAILSVIVLPVLPNHPVDPGG
ncbi:MAG: MgtC/SapB family protein [Holophaga sp.]